MYLSLDYCFTYYEKKPCSTNWKQMRPFFTPNFKKILVLLYMPMKFQTHTPRQSSHHYDKILTEVKQNLQISL